MSPERRREIAILGSIARNASPNRRRITHEQAVAMGKLAQARRREKEESRRKANAAGT